MHPHANDLSVAPLALFWTAYNPHVPDTTHIPNSVWEL